MRGAAEAWPVVGFEVLARDGKARRGRLSTAHGVVDTPVFMPVGTAGTVKAMTSEELRDRGAIVLGNTYHLMLRPGAERIAALGGLHRFMNWPHAILTIPAATGHVARRRRTITRRVTFRSHLDGSLHELTRSAQLRSSICSARTSRWLWTNARSTRPRARRSNSTELTTRWPSARAAPLSNGRDMGVRIVQAGSILTAPARHREADRNRL